MTNNTIRNALRGRLRQLLLYALIAPTGAGMVNAAESPTALAADSQQDAAVQLKEAARLYGKKDYAAAADIYRRLSEGDDPEQAAWALGCLAHVPSRWVNATTPWPSTTAGWSAAGHSRRSQG